MAWVGACVGLPAIFASAGCSLILDFSDSAIPVDATADSAFSQAECDFKEPNDNAGVAAMVDVTEVGPAAICADGFDDHDFYKFTLPANSSVNVSINFTSSPTGDLDLRLYDKTGATVLARSSGFADTESITCPGASPMCAALAPDDYIFEVFPAVLGAKNRYTMAITVTP